MASLTDRILSAFVCRTTPQVVVKPLMMYAGIASMVELLIQLLVPDTSSTLLARLAISFVVAVPFLSLAFVTASRLDRLQRQLALVAATDMLTGLANRHAFLARLRALHAQGVGGVLLAIDADHFKAVNDMHGHATGDACLRAIADALRDRLRAGDLAGRLGGEEFAAFLPGAGIEDAVPVGNRLPPGVSVPSAVREGDLVHVTLSVGAAHAAPDAPLERAFHNADAALYRAKAAGRARLEVFSPDDGGLLRGTG